MNASSLLTPKCDTDPLDGHATHRVTVLIGPNRGDSVLLCDGCADDLGLLDPHKAASDGLHIVAVCHPVG